MEFVFGLATGLILAFICLFSILLIRRRRNAPAITGAGTAAVPLPQDVDDDEVEYHSVGRSPLVGARPGGYRAVEALLRPGELT